MNPNHHASEALQALNRGDITPSSPTLCWRIKRWRSFFNLSQLQRFAIHVGPGVSRVSVQKLLLEKNNKVYKFLQNRQPSILRTKTNKNMHRSHLPSAISSLILKKNVKPRRWSSSSSISSGLRNLIRYPSKWMDHHGEFPMSTCQLSQNFWRICII